MTSALWSWESKLAEISNFDKKMFRKAREVAETSNFEHFHLGCVITYKRHILSAASNSNKTHPKQKYYNHKFREFRKGSKPAAHTVHAEMAAISDIPYPVGIQVDWKDVNVYVYRIAHGIPSGHGMARPCPACMAALKNLGVRNIYYTTDVGYAYEKLED